MTGIKYNTARDIVNGTTNIENIGAGTFVRIAHAFNMTADELIDEVDAYGESIPNDEDHELLSLFHKMDDGQRAALLAVAYAIVDGR